MISQPTPISLYIHVPFCIKKCPYCAFYKEFHSSDIENIYTNALCTEIETLGARLDHPQVNTIFWGGGTPNSLCKNSLEKIMTHLHNHLCIHPSVEITMEMNPELITVEQLRQLEQLGVNRLSLGIQSLDSKELQFLGRRHTKERALNAIKLCVENGFENTNIDIIYSTPHTTLKTLGNTIHTLFKYPIPHISTYSLTIESGTPFSARKLSPLDSDTEREQHEYIIEILDGYGLKHYEISAFSKPGKECRHNLAYWNFDNFLGIGPSAASFYDNKRFTHPYSLDDYTKAPTSLISYLENGAKENERDLKAEFIIAQLRLINGLSYEKYTTLFKESFTENFKKNISKLTKDNIAISTKTHLKLHPDFLFLSDSICEKLISQLD